MCYKWCLELSREQVFILRRCGTTETFLFFPFAFFLLFSCALADKEQGSIFFILGFNYTSKNCCLWSTTYTHTHPPTHVGLKPRMKKFSLHDVGPLSSRTFIIALSTNYVNYQIPCRWFPWTHDTNFLCILKLIYKALNTSYYFTER